MSNAETSPRSKRSLRKNRSKLRNRKSRDCFPDDMEGFFTLTFALLTLSCVSLEVTGRDRKRASNKQLGGMYSSSSFIAFRNNYLVVYSMMMAGDWLQGPYVYALYQHYGYGKGDIGRLFIAGFGSSMIFGTVVGSLADRLGRKRASLTYVVTYTLSCFTKHSPHYWVLMVGRILGGISTSLLFSAFESWLVAEHFKRGYDGSWLGHTFSKAVFFGNGLIAIISGLVANALVWSLDLGPVAPFDAASIVMSVGGLLIYFSWSENYGNKTSGSLGSQFSKAFNAIKNDKKIALLGAMQSLFEGSMYTFVFLWTPALAPCNEQIPHGFIFATFMLASMVGSSIANILMSTTVRTEKFMQYVFFVSALGLLVPVLVGNMESSCDQAGPGVGIAGKLQMVGFCLFEVCVGIFWPSLMKMRSVYVPEEVRSTIINFFRIPLNLFVCVVLYNVSSFPMAFMFGMCSFFLGVCVACQRLLEMITQSPGVVDISPGETSGSYSDP